LKTTVEGGVTLTAKTVKCVACAEEILAEAKLCRHCGTLQSDERFAIVDTSEEIEVTQRDTTQRTCLRCQKQLKSSDHLLCVECIEDLDEYESAVFHKGKNAGLCPKCELFIFNKAQSTFCHMCTKEAEPQHSNLLISWWLQAVFVASTFFLPDAFSDIRVVLLNVGGQLFGWNVILGIAFGIAYLALKRRAKTYRLRSWFYSTLTFGGVGLFLLIFVMILVGNQTKY
jgi:hypothetical protein